MELSSAEREALDSLLKGKPRTGDLKADLIAAGLEARRRREQNTIEGGHVFTALHRETRSWAIVAYLMGMKKTTVINWNKKLGETDAEAETSVEGETP